MSLPCPVCANESLINSLWTECSSTLGSEKSSSGVSWKKRLITSKLIIITPQNKNNNSYNGSNNDNNNNDDNNNNNNNYNNNNNNYNVNLKKIKWNNIYYTTSSASRSRWIKSCTMIGHPGRQHGAILPAQDYLPCPARKMSPKAI